MDIVRAHNRDRYLATLFAPREVQHHVFALYAFDAEIARIPSLVSEPQIGEIRMQWWRDTVEAIYAGDTPDHPVAQALAPAIKHGQLPQQPLQSLIDARVRELYADPMPSLNDLEGFLGETNSAIIQMAAQIILEGRGQGLAEAAGLGGVAQGIAELLARNVAIANLLPASHDREALIGHAQARLAKVDLSGISAKPAFLPLATIAARLKKLKKGKSLSHLQAQWLIWRAS
jgi:phytoene/squalene synthetase